MTKCIRLMLLAVACIFILTATVLGKEYTPLDPVVLEEQFHKTQGTTKVKIGMDLLSRSWSMDSAQVWQYYRQMLSVANTLDNGTKNEWVASCHLAMGRWLFEQADLRQSSVYCEKGIASLDATFDSRTRSELLYQLSVNYQRMAQHQELKQTLQLVRADMQQTSQPVAKAMDLITMGTYRINGGQIDSTDVYFKQALQLLEKQQDALTIKALCLRALGGYYARNGRLDQAIDYYDQNIELYKQLGLLSKEANTLTAIARLCGQQRRVETALIYIERAEKINEQLGNIELEALIYHHKADLYAKKKAHQKSIEYNQRCLKLIQTHHLGHNMEALCVYKLAQGYIGTKDYTKAMEYLNTALQLYDRSSFRDFYANTIIQKGTLYLNLNEPDKAESCVKEGLAIFQQLKYPKDISRAKRVLANVYEQQKKYREALNLIKTAQLIDDSLAAKNVEKLLLKKDMEHERAQMELELDLDKSKIDLLLHKQQTSTLQLYGMIVGFVMMVFIGLLLFRNYRQRKEKVLAQQQSEIELYMKELDVLRFKVNTQLTVGPVEVTTTYTPEAINAQLADPLSKRELEVLKELSTGKSNKEIAAALHVSVNTIRTHLMNIYTKLGVKNRTQAVKKAGDLQDG